MLVSNQRSLPCKGSATVRWWLPEFAKLPQISAFRKYPHFYVRFSPSFQEIYSGCCTVAAHSSTSDARRRIAGAHRCVSPINTENHPFGGCAGVNPDGIIRRERATRGRGF